MPQVLRKVGRYEIVRQVGRGGMATVYLARQADLDRYVALKELAPPLLSDPTFTKRFARESRVVASLSHPNIVTVHDYFEDGGLPYIAMEYLPRGSLRPHVGDLTLGEVAGVLEGLLAGLAQAQAHGVVHRDLKPENVMLTEDGRVKIGDFGIAKVTSAMASAPALTAVGMPIGTPVYMAPEQVLGSDVGPWTDLYSLGCMAYEMLCGRPPFRMGHPPMAVLMRHVHEEPEPPRSLNAAIDPDLSAWVLRLLVKDPKARTGSPGAAWDELEDILLATLGPRWRREARLTGATDSHVTPRPLTPASFDESHSPVVAGRPSPETVREEPVPDAAVTGAGAVEGTMDSGPATAGEDSGTEARADGRAQWAFAAEGTPATTADDDSGAQRAARATAAGWTVGEDEPAASPVESPPVASRAAPRDRPRRAVTPDARRRLAAIAAAAAVVCGLAGYALGSAGSADRRASARTAVSDGLSLQYPSRFRAVRPATEFRLAEPVMVARAADRRMTVEAGLTTADGPTLLAEDLTSKLDRVPPATRVRLGPYIALRYDDLRPSGSASALRAYAVPTTAGVATVLCAAPPPALRGFVPDCERIAQTMQIRAGRAFPAAPRDAYARNVDTALQRLGRVRRDGFARMKAARARSQQAAAARAIAGAYGRAAAELGGLDVSPYELRDTSAIRSALGAAQRDSSRLASAADGGDRGAYAAARRELRRAEDAADAAVARLGRLGYAIRR